MNKLYYQKLIEESNKKLEKIENKNKLRKNILSELVKESKNNIKILKDKDSLEATFNIIELENENDLLKDLVEKNKFNLSTYLNTKGLIIWKLEISETIEELRKGLMNRENIPANQGMLFIFPNLDFHSLWMKNTLIPLDALFLDENKKIIGLIENMEPKSEKVRSINNRSRFIIEINGGSIKKYNIKIGHSLNLISKDNKFEYYMIE